MVEIVVREFVKLKEQYGRTILRAAVLAIVVHALLFVLSPEFSFKPYELAQAEEITVVDVPPDIKIPKPPKDIPPPRNPEPAPDKDADTDHLPPTTWDSIDDMPGPPVIGGNSGGDFHAFDELPVLLRFEAPEYPQLARETGIEGVVEIKVLVGPDGKVWDAQVIFSEVTEEINQAVLEAVQRAFYRPAKQRHVAVPATVVMTYIFRLTD